MDHSLWQLTAERLGITGDCLLKRSWRRFVESFGKLCSAEGERALSMALGEGMPMILQVPREAEVAALAGHSVILKHRGQYFQVLACPHEADLPPDARLGRAASVIQKFWRRSRPNRLQCRDYTPALDNSEVACITFHL